MSEGIEEAQAAEEIVESLIMTNETEIHEMKENIREIRKKEAGDKFEIVTDKKKKRL